MGCKAVAATVLASSHRGPENLPGKQYRMGLNLISQLFNYKDVWPFPNCLSCSQLFGF